MAGNLGTCSEGRGHTFESCRVRHFGMKTGDAVFDDAVFRAICAG
jgi:hypothetical protein